MNLTRRYYLSLVPVVDVIPLIIGVIDRLNPQVLTANFAYSGALAEPWATLTSTIIALESVEDDDGAFSNDTRCTSRRD